MLRESETALWVVAVTLATGCGTGADGGRDSGGASGNAGAGGLNASGEGGVNASGEGGAAGAPSTAPTFTRVWNEVLVAKGCSGEFCHGSGTGTLSMDSQHDAYLSLVGVTAAGPACAASGQLRVSPGQPDASLLLTKMNTPAPSCGDVMPIGARLEPDCLDPSPAVCTTAAELDLVRAWIAAGALED